jgi:hypothetical protein
METTRYRLRPTTRQFALFSGVVGFAAGICFVMLYALAQPWTGVQNRWAWTGPANDWLGVVSWLALVPVALDLRSRMPASRLLTAATTALVVATCAALAIQIFRTSIVTGAITTYVIFIWILVVSLLGHRTRALPRTVTRPGLLIGGALPVGVALILPGLVTPDPIRWLFIGPGVAIGVVAYLSIPIFPLLLARFVLDEQSHFVLKEQS